MSLDSAAFKVWSRQCAASIGRFYLPSPINEFSWLSMRFSLPYMQLLYHSSQTLACHKTNSNNISQFGYSTWWPNYQKNVLKWL